MTNFDYVELPAPKESGFDLSYSNKLTMDIGDLVPVFKQEVLPGDEFKVNANFMCRFAPLANPIYTKLDAQIHYFFVPNRLIWDGQTKGDDWQTFITGGYDGSATPTHPYISYYDCISSIANSSEAAADEGALQGSQTLMDYMGIPLASYVDYEDAGTSVEGEWQINALPFRAYQKIYDDWFRDPNLTTSVFETFPAMTDGGQVEYGTSEFNQLTKIRKRAWSKDYFTSALPWAQRGEEVHIPVNTTGFVRTTDGGSSVFTSTSLINGANNVIVTDTGSTLANVVGTIGNNSIKLNDSALGTIRELRNASALQLWLEKNAVGGGRYIEQLLAHFGVYSDDARLQRAEYLGSVKSPVVVSEVQSTATVQGGSTLGELGGKALSYGNDFAFKEKFKEHGWIIGIMSIKPEASYCQGLQRQLKNRNEKLDYAFPEFAEIGLQEIEGSEIFARPGYENVTGTFGYNERYGEYKMNYNEIHGYFKNPYDTRSQYNMTRFFEDGPELNDSFVEIWEEDLNSPFVDTESNSGNIWVDLWNDVKAVRPLPKNSIPLFN